MKTSGTCPKCQGTSIFHSPHVMDRGDGNIALALAITRTDPIHADEVGFLEVYACRACGFSELYVKDPRELRRVVDGGHVDVPAPDAELPPPLPKADRRRRPKELQAEDE